ncbi:hypothetical protein [Aerococcus sp. 1KP-2016]|uniref:hypothetical protein n=1 Tax=Aerococcus sp. 1KP-2016 TaxID=1981982 RepID=UPI0018F23870|nr:hypothetical protein [Aerococcus sp. 1KP-2016]
MTDNIKPEHYRTGEIDLFEEWYLTYPFEQYRAIMQSHAEKYLRRNKVDRVEDLGKAIYTLEILKEKEIEHAGGDEESITKDGTITYKSEEYENTFLLKGFLEHGFNYLARDFDGDIYVYKFPPMKRKTTWYAHTIGINRAEKINDHSFPEVGWSDKKPTKIADLLATYENGGENRK